jgi:predicted transcriptional regulator
MGWDEIYFVTKNKIRFRVLVNLKKDKKTPSELSKELPFPITHISTALKNLEETGFVECLDPSARKNKYFRITPAGINLLSKIKDVCS